MRMSSYTRSVSNEMRLKLKGGLVTFENTIRTINCFPILFPKQFLRITVTLYTSWRLIQGLVHRYSSLPRRRGFRHAFLPQDGEDCVESQEEPRRETSPSADRSHPARDTKVVYDKTKKYTSDYKPPPLPEALTYYDVSNVNLRPVNAEWSLISSTACCSFLRSAFNSFF